MKFHVTMAFKKKVIETANPFIAKGAISRAFGLATSNFGLQRWHEEWRDWVDVDTAELQDGDRLNVVFTQEFSNTPVLNHEESAQNINCMQEIVDSLIPEGSSEKHEPSSSTSVKKQTDQLEFKPWPVPFRLPSQLFRPDLKAMLAVKQTLNRKMKSALIQTCYDEMITYTLYPTSTQYKEVALSIITEYPYLRDNIPGCKGYESWSATLSDKFRNERRIMTNVEVVEKRKRKRTAVDAEALTESQMDKNAVNCSIQPDGLESLAASSGLSSVIESLESCTSNYTNKVLPGDSLVSVSTPMRLAPMFKKAYIEPEHADGVLKALGLLWRQGKLCDAVICSGDNKIMLHRLLLFAVSPHLLEKNIRDGAELEVNLPGGIGDEALAAFVSFLYDGVLNLTENMYKDVERIGTLLKVEKVIRYCKEFLVSLTEHRNALSQPQSHVSDGHPENSRRKRGRHSKQTVVVNLAEESCHEDQRTTYLSHPDFPAFPGSTSKDRGCSNTEMPVTFPDSQEYCIPSTSHLSSVYSPISGQVKTEPYQMVEDFSANFSSNKGPNKLSEKNDGFLHQDSLGQGIESRCGSSKDNRNFSPNSIEQLPTATTGSGRSLKPASKSQSPGTKYDQQGSVITQSSGTSPFPVSLVASSGETFPLYSLQSS